MDPWQNRIDVAAHAQILLALAERIECIRTVQAWVHADVGQPPFPVLLRHALVVTHV